ncbi:MAG: TAXI family TRAP transporter solute-binding subunit, partial [Planctomycetota bacterium]|nr:TAXI family TRAP transporter solute-binding subunit [Planctomycetota bacterium]
MAKKKKLTVRRAMAYLMFTILLGSLLTWYFSRETLPAQIRIGAGATGGLYHEFALRIKRLLEARFPMKVVVVETSGSSNNRERLLSGAGAGRVDLAVLQDGAVSMTDLYLVAPLYRELLHVIVRKDRGIESISGLEGKRVAVGLEGSGMQASADNVLAHYQLEVNRQPVSFSKLLTDPALDAAVVTSGLLGADLRKILIDERFDLLAVEDAEAFEEKHFFFRSAVIPKGLYSEKPYPTPSADLKTIATTASLVAGPAVNEQLVEALTGLIYESELRQEFLLLMDREDAAQLSSLRLHPASRKYFFPQDEIGELATLLESISAAKELFFAIAAGLYLLWDRLKRRKEKDEELRYIAQRESLDDYLDRTLAIEREQMELSDIEALESCLERVTLIKLEALGELTHQDLRSNQAFTIFLMQCANLISKIQRRIEQVY